MAKIVAIYPTTPTQQGILIASASAPGDALFVEQATLELRGSVDRTRLERAWEVLVSQHESLRTAFSWDAAGQPRQVVLESAEPQIEFRNAESRAQADVAVAALLQEHCAIEINLRRPPLVRLAMISASPESHFMVWSHHHAILDGWSHVALLGALLKAYNGARDQRVERVAFGHFASALQRRNVDAEVKFWRSALREWTPSPILPMRSIAVHERYGSRMLVIDEELWRRLKDWSSAAGLTVGSTLIACCGIVVGRLLSRDRVTIGITHSGRTQRFPETASMIGPLTNTLPLPVCADMLGDTFAAHVRQMQSLLADMAEASHASAAEVRGWVNAPAGWSPECVVAVANYPGLADDDAWDLRAVSGTLRGAGGRTPLPLTFVMESSAQTSIRIVWDRRRLPDSAGEWVIRALEGVSIAIANDTPSSATFHDVPTLFSTPIDPHGLNEAARGKHGYEDALTKRLAERFAAVLGIQSVRADDSFFELGGHSLAALELLEDLRGTLALELSLVALLRHQTPSAIAQHWQLVRGETPTSKHEPLPALTSASEADAPFDLSPIQQAYWAGRQSDFELSGVDSHLYAEIDVEDLDLARLQSSWNVLIRRHPMLRSVITSDGRQRVLRDVDPYMIRVVDLRGVAEQSPELEHLRASLSHTRRDVTSWPLFTIECAQIDEHRTRLFVSFDLLIGDAHSWKILYMELREVYAQGPGALVPLEITYADYIRALSLLRSTERFAKARSYWRERLQSLPQGPRLPRAHPQAPALCSTFKRSHQVLSASETSHLRATAAELGVTPSVLFLGAFACVLAHNTQDRRFLLNLTLYDRVPFHPQVDSLIGDFTSLLLLEVSWSSTSFSEEVRRIQQQLWRDLDHRWYGGLDVLRDIKRGQPVGRGLEAPVVFTSTLDGKTTGELTDFELVYSIGQTPQVLLDYQVYEVNGRAHICWDRPAGVLDENWLAAVFDMHTQLLLRLASAGAKCIDLPTHVECQVLDHRDELLHDGFLEHAAKRPHAPAVISTRLRLSYGELLQGARSLAARIALHCDKSEPVAIVMEKGWEQVVAAIACSLVGRPFVPIESSWPEARIASIWESLGRPFILKQAWLATEQTPTPATRQLVVDASCLAQIDPLPVVTHGAESLAYMICTSGTTGTPKGVMITHRAAINTIKDINERFRVSADDAVFSVSPFAFDLAIYDIFGLLAAGGTIVLPDAESREDPSHWRQILLSERVTIWNSVPILMDVLLEAVSAEAPHRNAFAALRLCLLSGDWIPMSLPERIRNSAAQAQVVSLGGATECAIWSILYEIGIVDSDWKSVPYGRSMRNQEVVVLDEERRPCAPGEPGELYIAGCGLAEGYWADEAATTLAFVRDPMTGKRMYRTGDRGVLLEDGNIELLGRMDRQVKVDGYRIELSEVEHALERLKGVRAAAVVAIGERTHRKLLAFVKGDVDSSSLRGALGRLMPAHMVPSTIHVLPDLPRTSNGKIDRRQLLKLANAEERDAAPAPSSAHDARVRETVAACVAKRCGVSLGWTANLVQSGITSIDAIRLLNDVEHHFGVRVSVRELYARPTIEDLALAVQRLLAHRNAAIDAQLEENGISRPEGESPWKGSVLREPSERASFRQRARCERPLPTAVEGLLSTKCDESETDLPWGTVRAFSGAKVPRKAVTRLVDVLQARLSPSGPQFMYPSAGGLYRVDTYIHIRPDRVDGIQPGLYLYDPIQRNLIPQHVGLELSPSLHVGTVNAVIAESAAFTIFLVTDPRWSVPLYGDDAQRLSLLNAGYIGQLLVGTAPRVGLALCPVEGYEFESVGALFSESGRPVLLHMLVGGAPASSTEARACCNASATVVRTPSAVEVAPLSPSQERLLKAEYWVDTTNAGECLRPLDTSGTLIEGPLDLAVLRRAVAQLIDHQPTLRTGFDLHRRDRSVQFVKEPGGPVPFAVEHASSADESPETLMRRYGWRKPAATLNDLFSVLAIVLAPERHLLLISIHHLLSDAWSVALLQQQLSELYASSAGVSPAVMPPLDASFGFFCRNVSRHRSTGAYAAQLQYWKSQLSDGIEPSAFRERTHAVAIGRVRVWDRLFEIEADVIRKLKAVSAAAEVPGGVGGPILAAVSLLVHALTGAELVDIANMVPGRANRQFERICGAFVNIVTIRARIAADTSVTELITAINRSLLAALDNADVPIQDVLQVLGGRRSSSITVAINTMAGVGPQFPKAVCTPVDVLPHDGSREVSGAADQRWVFESRGDGMIVSLSCRADIFCERDVDNMERAFRVAIERLADPGQVVSALAQTLDLSALRDHSAIAFNE